MTDVPATGRSSDSVLPPPGSPYRLRMKDLCEATGLPRQAIHFYIHEGLLPPGHKTGRNMAFYGDEHVARLKLIKNLQHERFLPLKAIKALLDGQESQFSGAQRRLLGEIKQRFTTSSLAHTRGAPEPTVLAEDAAAHAGVPRADLLRAIELGILGAREDEAGRTLIAGCWTPGARSAAWATPTSWASASTTWRCSRRLSTTSSTARPRCSSAAWIACRPSAAPR